MLSHDPQLPAVCMKCGAHDTVTREPKVFHWRPTWARYLVVCGIGLLVMALTTQSASLEIPLCAKCYARWSTARSMQIAAAVLVAVGFAVLWFVDIEYKRIALASFLGTVAVFVAISVAFVRKRMLRASAIDEKEIGLLGIHATAIEEILAGAEPVNERPPLPPPTSAS